MTSLVHNFHGMISSTLEPVNWTGLGMTIGIYQHNNLSNNL